MLTNKHAGVPAAWRASASFADLLTNNSGWKQAPQLVTWLNHYSAQRVDPKLLRMFDFVGVDGTLLQLLLRASYKPIARTSADMVIPLVIEAVPEPRVVLIGGAPGIAERAALRLKGVVGVIDGYQGVQGLCLDELSSYDANLYVVSLGPRLQEEVACKLGDTVPFGLIMTAGGWLDQLAQSEHYFSPWVHRVRCGWVVRLMREPSRLWRRYTVDALKVIRGRTKVVELLHHARINDVAFVGLKAQDSEKGR